MFGFPVGLWVIPFTISLSFWAMVGVCRYAYHSQKTLTISTYAAIGATTFSYLLYYATDHLYLPLGQ